MYVELNFCDCHYRITIPSTLSGSVHLSGSYFISVSVFHLRLLALIRNFYRFMLSSPICFSTSRWTLLISSSSQVPQVEILNVQLGDAFINWFLYCFPLVVFMFSRVSSRLRMPAFCVFTNKVGFPSVLDYFLAPDLHLIYTVLTLWSFCAQILAWTPGILLFTFFSPNPCPGSHQLVVNQLSAAISAPAGSQYMKSKPLKKNSTLLIIFSLHNFNKIAFVSIVC